MAVTLQVLYPITEGSTFDDAYYTSTHLPLVDTYMGAHMQSMTASKGLAGGPDAPPAFHVVATLVFPDMEALQAALGGAGPVLADIPKFTNAAPTMLIGEVMA
jgi:uncharacterized protein (TIGR02118 family)